MAKVTQEDLRCDACRDFCCYLVIMGEGTSATSGHFRWDATWSAMEGRFVAPVRGVYTFPYPLPLTSPADPPQDGYCQG